jgi:hypothetical protein
MWTLRSQSGKENGGFRRGKRRLRCILWEIGMEDGSVLKTRWDDNMSIETWSEERRAEQHDLIHANHR